MRQRIDAVIFDMDGTLIDSEPLWHKAEIRALASIGYTITGVDCYQMVGTRIDKVVAAWQERFGWPIEENQRVEDLITSEVARLISLEGEVKEGVYQTLNLLAETRIPLAIASSSPRRLIDAVIERFEFNRLISTVHSAEGELHGKPDPAVFLTTAAMLGVEPAHCLVFEDSLLGIRAAKAAGMICVAVEEPATPFKEAQALADFSLHSFTEFSSSEVARLLLNRE